MNLTIQQHAQAHHILYELNGSEFDQIAGRCLSGQIGKEEAIRLAQIHSNRTRVITDSHRDNQSNRMKGRKHTTEHNEKIAKSLAIVCRTRKRNSKGKFICS